MEKLFVIKIGGNIIDDDAKLAAFLADFAALQGAKILVHGGGKIATAIGGKLGIESKYEHGRRITDKETLDLVTMVYAGLINKKIVAALQASGCNAIGLTGADANILSADKRPVRETDFGFVGDVKQDGVNGDMLQLLLSAGVVPVMAPLTHNGKGDMLNTNADTIAQEIAKTMAAVMDVQLIYCFEKKGLLMDLNDDNSVIRHIDDKIYADILVKEIISAGMIPKLKNALEAIRQKVTSVTLGHAEDLNQLAVGNAGTKISL